MEEETLDRPLKEMRPLKELPLLTEHPQTINLFRYTIPPEFSGKRTEFRDFVSGLRIYFDLNKWSFMGDKEKVLFTILYL